MNSQARVTANDKCHCVEDGDKKGQIPIIKLRRRRVPLGPKRERRRGKGSIPVMSETPVDPSHNLMMNRVERSVQEVEEEEICIDGEEKYARLKTANLFPLPMLLDYFN